MEKYLLIKKVKMWCLKKMIADKKFQPDEEYKKTLKKYKETQAKIRKVIDDEIEEIDNVRIPAIKEFRKKYNLK